MDDIKRYMRLVRVLYYLIKLDEEFYVEFEDVNESLKLITPLLPYNKTRGIILKLNNSLSSSDLFDVIGEMMDEVGCELTNITFKYPHMDLFKIKRLYFIYLEIKDLNDVNEFFKMRDESIKLFDLLHSKELKNSYHDLYEEIGLNEESERVIYAIGCYNLFNLMREFIMRELKFYGCDLSEY